jgi:hypothetical protein
VAAGEFGAALKEFDESLRLNPKDPGTYRDRGVTYTLGRPVDRTRALGDLTESLRLDPNSAESYKARAAVFERLSKWDRAVDDWTSALRLTAGSDPSIPPRLRYAASQQSITRSGVRSNQPARGAPAGSAGEAAPAGSAVRGPADDARASADAAKAQSDAAGKSASEAKADADAAASTSKAADAAAAAAKARTSADQAAEAADEARSFAGVASAADLSPELSAGAAQAASRALSRATKAADEAGRQLKATRQLALAGLSDAAHKAADAARKTLTDTAPFGRAARAAASLTPAAAEAAGIVAHQEKAVQSAADDADRLARQSAAAVSTDGTLTVAQVKKVADAAADAAARAATARAAAQVAADEAVHAQDLRANILNALAAEAIARARLEQALIDARDSRAKGEPQKQPQ